ncbi:MAG: threonine--tRNA ligase [Candidatus Woesearchaeota archaeon]|nr:MAG: threonine--tRNA ligase [Candidatus Woesearchaeota archaeon]
MNITFPDGSKKEFKEGTTGSDIALSISEGFARKALAITVNGQLQDLATPLTGDASVVFLTFDDAQGKELFWHSSAHVLAQAVLRLFPEAKPTIGPAIEQGFYYDFANVKISEEDLVKIEEEAKKIIEQDFRPTRKEFATKDAAKKEFATNKYKVELIEEMEGGITAYTQGEFTDLCRGPHLPRLGMIKAFKVTKTSGAYWRAHAENDALTRIYGISFPDKKLLKEYLTVLEEAKKRDHRKIGKELDLFSFHEEGAGFPFWHPKGMELMNTIIDYWKGVHKRDGYVEIKTPIVLNRSLWERSGHWDHYQKNMYFFKIDGGDHAVKPMNCPGGVLVFKSRKRSYKELPMKIGELGLVHRHELAGVLHGLFRVRSFTQDDAHIYCLPEQVADEIVGVLNLVYEIYATFGFDNVAVELSTMPDDHIGSEDMWTKATNALREALEKKNIAYQLNEGDGAFYGPKIDFHIRDSMGRTWQCGTIQVDFAMPETLDITYMGDDGTYDHRPVMIHRAIFGSLERFIGILIEHYAGKFPLWLAPVQVKFITVADRHLDYARKVAKELGLRYEIDENADTLNKKVRNAQLEQVPLIITIGDQEQETGKLSVRTLDGSVTQGMDLAEFKERVQKLIATKAQTTTLE